jgi:circadian clock protein KaiB
VFTVLQMFISGNTNRSQDALERVREACQGISGESCQLSVVDVLQTPEEAQKHKIVATPSLLRLAPLPVVHLVGDMQDPAQLRQVVEGPAGALLM